MRYRYEDSYWEDRIERAVRGRSGFAWGTFLVGMIIGGMLF